MTTDLKLALAASIAALSLGACVGVGVDSYEDFEASVRVGASCSELFDQRSNFDDTETLAKIDADLAEIGCDDRSSERTDS